MSEVDGGAKPAKKSLAPAPSTVEVVSGAPPSLGIEMGDRSSAEEPKAEARFRGQSVEFEDGAKGPKHHFTDEPSSQEPEDDDPEDGDEEEGAAAGEEDAGDDTSTETSEELPEFNAEDADVVAKYDGRYLKEGNFDLDALGTDWWASAKRTEDGASYEGSLPEGTYAYLAAKGFSKEFVKNVEAGLVAQQVIREGRVYERAGGRPRFDAAVEWARQGGYTSDQLATYNAAVSTNEDAKIADAVDLLMGRYEKETGKTKPAKDPVSPAKSTSGAGGTTKASGKAVEPYADWHEWNRDFRAAKKSGSASQLAQVRRRLQASPWH